MSTTLYDRLSVSCDAPPEVIRAAYRALSQRHHPDRRPGDASAARAMQAINDAYAVLSDPLRRQAYDASLLDGARAAALRSTRNTAAPGHRVPEDPKSRSRASRWPLRWWSSALVALVALPLGGAGIALWHAHRADAPIPSPRAPVEWRIHGVDSQPPQPHPHPQATQRQSPRDERARPARADAASAPNAVAVSPPPSLPRAGPGASGTPLLPIVADPNGRPWPLGAAYVAGLPQTRLDGLSAVVLDNAMNPAPVFVTLVALDDDAAQPVRHVHVPAMGRFRIESVRPGRYEVHHRNLVTGALTRSEAFELRQVTGRHGTQASERAVALDPWAHARAAVAASAF